MPLPATSARCTASVASGVSSPFSGRHFFAGLLQGVTLGLFVACAGRAWAADAVPAESFKRTIPEIATCQQMILVTTKDWSSVDAVLSCFERANKAAGWTPAFPPFQAVVGRSGLAWGIGLHGTRPPDGPGKREGDGCAPAGVFALDTVFGYAAGNAANVTGFPYRPLSVATRAVDDPASQYYNRMVDAPPVEQDWNSAETMRRDDELYRWGVFVRHNWARQPKMGSCIFLHIWKEPSHPTSGCTAMPMEQIVRIVHWLDEKKNPLLVQLPEAEYARLRESWLLPMAAVAHP